MLPVVEHKAPSGSDARNLGHGVEAEQDEVSDSFRVLSDNRRTHSAVRFSAVTNAGNLDAALAFEFEEHPIVAAA